MRRMTELCLIAAALSLMSGCAVMRLRRNGTLAPGSLTAYSESVLEPSAASSAPLMAQQSPPPTRIEVLPPEPATISTSVPVIVRQTTAAPAPPPVPAPAQAPESVSSEQVVVLRGVLFEKDSCDLDDLQEIILDEAIRTLKAHPNVRIYVKGYSDSRGNPLVNQKLSQERAASVAAYLESNGVPLGQMIVLGMGPSHPVASNATAAGRAMNRRVELEPVIEESTASSAG